MIEQVRKRRQFKVVLNLDRITKYVSRPDFKRRVIVNEETNLCLVEMRRTKIYFNKPLQVGSSILDISKNVILDFHYNVMLSMIELQEPEAMLELLYGDTDSLIYEITLPHGRNFYTDVLPKYSDHFDFSSYPSNHILFSNKKVPAKFSDETRKSYIIEFIALRPKLYSFKTWSFGSNTITNKKAKGVKKNIVSNEISFDDYHRVLEQGIKLYAKQYSIQSTNLNVYTKEQIKVAISGNDDKRFILSDCVHTLAWGHKLLQKMENQTDGERNLNILDYELSKAM